jgi:hypothetical protein
MSYKRDSLVGVWNRWFKDYTKAVVIEVKGKTLFVQYLVWANGEDVEYTACQSVPAETCVPWEERNVEERLKPPSY